MDACVGNSRLADKLRSVFKRLLKRQRTETPVLVWTDELRESAIRFPGAPLVLHIDDETSVRLLVRVNFEEEGINVIEAADGVSGVELARAAQPDLILLDVMHPGPDGYEVAQVLKADESTREIPLMFVTARADFRDRARGLALGAVDYVTKPFNPLELAPLVRETLARVARGEREELRREKIAELRSLMEDDAADETALPTPPSAGESFEGRRNVLRRVVTSAPGVFLALAVTALIGAGIYFGIVHPSLAYDQDQSYAWSRDCVDRSGGVARDDSPEGRLAVANLLNIGGVRALGMNWQTQRGVVLFADSTGTARQVERELNDVMQKRGASQVRISHQLVRQGPELIIYAKQPPTGPAQRSFAECVYLIEQNRWTGWIGFDTKSVGRPFLSAPTPK